eukprot:4487955-Pleurochrysis_carterae.AAC.1
MVLEHNSVLFDSFSNGNLSLTRTIYSESTCNWSVQHRGCSPYWLHLNQGAETTAAKVTRREMCAHVGAALALFPPPDAAK